jgi:sugar/nucleoside kinase (ribokinase family)
MQLQPDIGICRDILSRATLVHFHIPNWARHLLPIAKKLNLTIACDIQDVVAGIDEYRKDFVDFADILFLSATNQANPKALMEDLLRAHPRQTVIAGMGAKGCALGTSEGIRFFPPPDMEKSVIDATGAGDGLAVGFLSSFVLDNYSVGDAIQRGQLMARHACTLKATSSNLITPEELDFYFGGRSGKSFRVE